MVSPMEQHAEAARVSASEKVIAINVMEPTRMRACRFMNNQGGRTGRAVQEWGNPVRNHRVYLADYESGDATYVTTARRRHER